MGIVLIRFVFSRFNFCRHILTPMPKLRPIKKSVNNLIESFKKEIRQVKMSQKVKVSNSFFSYSFSVKFSTFDGSLGENLRKSSSTLNSSIGSSEFSAV